MVKEKSVGAVVFRRGGKNTVYLLLHYHFKSDYWDFPKGNMEKGESEEETAQREVKEETGLSDIKIFPGFKEKIKYFYMRDGKTVFKEVVFYLAESKTGDVKVSFEHTGFEWAGFDDAMGKLKKKSKGVLKKANNFLNRRLAKWV